MRRSSLLVVLFAGFFLGGCKNIVEGLKEQVYIYVSGQVAAAMTEEATLAIQERLLESLTGVDAEYQGDGKWVLIPLEGQPPLGANVATGATSGSITIKSFRAMATGATSKTGYTLTQGAGPDGFIGWYETRANGLIFYYKTIPVSDLSQGWPAQVQTLYSGWKADTNSASYRGYSWWMKNSILSSTHVQGEWHFNIAADAPQYAGTSYNGTYDYEQEKGVKAIVGVTGAMRLQYTGGTREAYTSYSYAFTNQTGIESGRYFYGVGPEKAFTEHPEWAQSANPAGPEWTDRNDRPGLSYFKVWVDKAYSWWRYDGTSQSCSSEASTVDVSGAGVVTAGKTIQLNAVARNNCNDVLRYRTFQWSSSLPDIATVNASGLVTARAAGETVIEVKSGSAVKTVNVSVREFDPRPSYITIGGGSNVQVGSTMGLSAVVYNKNNEALEAAPAWSASNGNASVSSTGIVTGLAAGAVNIAATSGDVTAVRSVQVFDPSVVSTVSVSCNRNNVVVGSNTAQCTATMYNYAGSAIAGSVTWGSSNTAILTVDSSGIVTPVSSGTALVRATSTNGKTATRNMASYSQNDISYVVVGSANGSSLRIGDSAFKLSLEAKAYNFNSDEIQGASFNWSILDYPSRASVVAQSPNSLAQVSVGSQEGYVTIQATTGSIVGSFQAGAWDNRIATINITNEPSYTLAENSTHQLYVQARNANNRSLGYITPTWSNTGSITITTAGLMTASGVGNGSVTASMPRGDGSGNATDTVNFNIIDPALVTVLQFNSCSSNVYTGTSFTCSVTAKNGLNQTVSGAPVTWSTNNTARATVQAPNNAGSPSIGNFSIPGGILTGGPVIVRPWIGSVTHSGATINVKGSNDIQSIVIDSPGASSYPIPGVGIQLTAKAYDFQSTPQQIVGVPFTWSKSGNGYTNPATAAGMVWPVNVNGGSPTYFYATNGSVTSSYLALTATDPDQAFYVDVYRSNSASNFLHIGDTFTVWARAFRDAGRTQEIFGKTFTFSSPSNRVTFSGAPGTTATATVALCTCSNATVSSSIAASTSGAGWSQNGSTYFNINNPIWHVWIAEAQNQNLPEGSTYPLTVTFSGYNGGAISVPSTPGFSDQSSGAFDVTAGGVIQNMVFNALTSTYSVSISPYQASTGSYGQVTYFNFKIVPTTIDMTAATHSASAPSLANDTLEKLYYFMDAPQYARAQTYASLDTDAAGATPEQTWSITFAELVNQYNGVNAYGIRTIGTGDVYTSRVGVRLVGYIRFGAYSTIYTRLDSRWDGARIRIGGVKVLDRWTQTGSQTSVSASLINLEPNHWYPIEVEGLLNQGYCCSSGYQLMNVSWSTGSSFYGNPQSQFGFKVGRD